MMMLAQPSLLRVQRGTPTVHAKGIVHRGVISSSLRLQGLHTVGTRRSPGVVVYSAAVSQSEGEGVVGTRPDLRELNKDDFYPALEEAGTTLVVVDFYTNWCGPCKAILPKILGFRDEYDGQVLFYKFNCNKNNKELGQKLGIKVAPTFQLYKQGAKVAEVTGAKADVLKQLIEQHK